MIFPQSTFDYLNRHKGAAGASELDTQVARSLRLFQNMTPIVDRYRPARLLDIGCGLGLGTVMIARHIGLRYLALMDGDGTGELFSDYRAGAPAWNDVAVAGDLARTNLVSCEIETFTQDPGATIPVDMIVSFKSWGTHYPIGEYIPLAQRSLKRGGIVVTDLRDDDPVLSVAQVDVMRKAGFDLVAVIGRRHVFEKGTP